MRTVCFFLTLVFSIAFFPLAAQMRQIHLDQVNTNNEIKGMSFLTPAEGFVACTESAADWVGYTTDSGRTYVKRYITLNNVDYGSYSVNLTFGFGLKGVKAFSATNIIAWGDYGLVPAILRSTNGGVSYTLIYHSQFNAFQLLTGIEDVLFPENGNVGYAIDADRILKTTNQGVNWSVVRTDPGSFFDYLEAVDNNTVFALSTDYVTNKLLKTTDGGATWQAVMLPSVNTSKMRYAHFLTANTGWLSMYDYDNNEYLYKTTDGGVGWVLQNNVLANPFAGHKLKFTDVNTGYALYGQNTVYKTIDGGRTWEPLSRDNSFAYLGFSHSTLYFYSPSQFWAGGYRAFLEITNNSGGTPLPRAYFRIDTTGYSATGSVSLVNHSRNTYTCKWFVNNVQISTAYNTSYTHNTANTADTIKLVVSNGITTDTTEQIQFFNPPVTITSFTPATAATGTTVTINGSNFTAATAVNFGGVAASSFSVISSTSISAVVGNGASGQVRVFTPIGQGALPGFIYIQPPTITTFIPASATAGTVVTITGTNFTGTTAVNFAGVPAVSFTVVSSTTITAVAPSGPSGTISVTAPGGTANASGYSSLPTINAFTPLQGTYGTLMTINGTSLSGATGVTVGGINVVSYTVNSANSITAVVNTGATGDVTVTKASGNTSLGTFTWYPPPVITSFLPASGPVGTIVTITGTGFHPVAANNTVYFGAVKATITGGTATSLTVTVPQGASFGPISIVSNLLLGYSTYPFLVTFPNGGSITASSFANRTVVSAGSNNGPQGVATGDFDNDGKTDVAIMKFVVSGSNSGILVYRNTSTGTAVTFDVPVELVGGYNSITTGDMDGDGKLDIVLSGGTSIRFFRNISVPGAVSFSLNHSITEANPPSAMCIADFDGDGKADLMGSRYWSESGSKMYRNQSEPGAMKFATPVLLNNTTAERNILPVDMDGDKKPDLVIGGLGVMKNNCTLGNFSFAPPVPFGTFTHSHIAYGDMDGDGKTDIISGDMNGSTVAVIKNISTTGSLSFAAPVQFVASSTPSGIAISDLDGDGRLDITAGLINYSITVFKNTSTPGNISFAPQQQYNAGSYGGENMVAAGDLNSDGKADVIVTSELLRSFSVHINDVKPEPFIQAFSPTSGVSGTTVTITGTNFTGTSAVSFGGVPASSFVVNSPGTITAVVGTGASGGVSVTNTAGTGTLSGFVFGAVPVITAISPLSGAVGSTVTITGNSFNVIPDNNIVYFGGVKALITGATATSLTAKVPFGSMYEPVSVTVANRTAYSKEAFTTTFSTGSPVINENSFAQRMDITGIGGGGCIADIDTDGKPDIIAANSSTTFVVARNTSITANLSFATPVSFTTATSPGRMTTGDLDGDGRLDVAIICGSSTLSVLRNTSVSGNISFALKTDYPTGVTTANPSGVVISDIDKDGKPDIVVSNYSLRTLTVFKNTTSGTTLSFAAGIDYILDGLANSVLLWDMDADNLPDLLGSSVGPEEVSVFRNTSLTGTISFASKIDFGTGQWPSALSAGDIDGDGKPDITVANTNGGGVSLVRNISTTGNIAFAPKVDMPTGGQVQNAAMNDLDGDGKVDIYTSNLSSGTISVLKNNSSSGAFSIAPRVDYSTANYPGRLASADMDGDGRAEIVVFGNNINIFRNQIGGAGPVITSFSPASTVMSGTVVLTGTGFTGTTTVTFGGVPASSFTVNSNSSISAVVSSGASGHIAINGPAGMASLNGFIFGAVPVISQVVPSAAGPGATVQISGGNFTGITAINFGGVPVSSFTVNSNSSITAVIGSGANGSISVTNSAGTGTYSAFTFLAPPGITSFTPTSGGGGSTITITGTNLIGTTGVTFGGVAAQTFTVVSASTITAVVQSGSAGTVSVVTPAGVANAPGFTFLASPNPQSFYPTSAVTGSTVFITGTNLGGVTAVSFGGTPAQSFTITSPSTITAVVGGGASGSVTVSNGIGSPVSISGFTYLGATSAPYITGFSPAIAANGTAVTITGFNFSGATAISFGGTAAGSFTVNSPSSITAVVRGGASGSILVTTTGGTATAANFIYSDAPVITGVSPVKAMPGSVVTISGNNFNPQAAGNTVYFGNIKGGVVSATSSELRVTVPHGAVYGPLSVTVNTLTGYSSQRFLPFFYGEGRFGAAAFPIRTDSASSAAPQGIALADIDADGKPDVTSVNNGSTSLTRNVSFYKNNGSAGQVSLLPRTILPFANAPDKVSYTDFDGDGLLDLMVSQGGDLRAVSVYKNNSTGSSITFGPELVLTAQLGAFRAATGDFNGDGKPDIAVIGNYSSSVSVYKNISTATSILFDTRLVFGVSVFPTSIMVGDIDIDGKADIVVCGGNNGFVQILRNTSTSTTVSFASTTYSTMGICRDVAVGDFDDDGKPDIAVLNGSANRLTILKNNSIPGFIQFFGGPYYITGAAPVSLSIADIDGNGKGDIIVANSEANIASIFANSSSPGNILFDYPVDIPVNSPSAFTSVADMDGDGKPDIVLANPLSNSLSVLRNMHTSTQVSIISFCANGNTSFTSNLTGTTYKWQQNTGLGFANINDNSNFSGTSTSTLQLTNIPASWNNYDFRCLINGSQSSQVFRLNAATLPTVIISGNTTVIVGQSTLLTAVAANAGGAPQYQWQDSTASHTWQNISGASQATLNYTPVATGIKIRCLLTASTGCAVTVYSNIMTVTTITAVSPVPGASLRIRCFPNPVSDLLYVDSLQIADKWETAEIINLNGTKVLAQEKINGKTTLQLQVQQLVSGGYIVLLRRRNGAAVYLKFIKQ